MKYLDKVKVIKDREEYKKDNVFKGRVGTIMSAEIRDNTFYVVFIDPNTIGKNAEWIENNWKTIKDDDFSAIKIEDLEVVEDGKATDEMILGDIPLNNKKWWCKVENGYIVNLLGEKKNKIPYDYNS